MLDEVYLCIKKNMNRDVECKRFDDYRSASDYFINNHKNDYTIDSSTMIPVFKFMPFKKTYLWYKFSHVFIKIN